MLGINRKGSFSDLLIYYQCLWYISCGRRLKTNPYFRDNLVVRNYVYSLGMMFYLWDKPHYRTISFQQDLKQNLANVYIPYTLIPLSVFCYSRYLMWWFLLVLYPLICLGMVFFSGKNIIDWGKQFSDNLLIPKSWFAIWRMNCVLVTLHAYLTGHSDYDLEDKWLLIKEAERQGIPISPYYEIDKLFVKHRNLEGGLGCHVFDSVSINGDWIFQETFSNHPFISKWLPNKAPLSSFRIVTINNIEKIIPLTCVFRAGLNLANTDHDSILFSVDLETGVIGYGSSNCHWYGKKWLGNKITHHPETLVKITGEKIPCLDEMLSLVKRAHSQLVKNVPLVGWDVAMTTQGMFLLEANFSVNLFEGSYESQTYYRIIDEYFRDLETYRI